MRERELIEGADVDERSVVFGDPRCIGIFRNWFLPAGPFAESSYGFFIKPLQGILDGEGRTDDGQHDVVANREWIGRAGGRVHTAIGLPELSDIAEVRVGGRKMALLKVSFGLIAPHDIPLRVGVKRIDFGAAVVGEAGSLGGVLDSARGRAEI